jgi:toxin ParE1/3/4
MAAFRYTADARRHLADIWTHTDEKWGAAQADRYLRDIEARIVLSLRMPGLLRPRPEIAEEVLSLPALSHTVFAKREPNGDLVILAVLHQRMDAKTRLSDE